MTRTEYVARVADVWRALLPRLQQVYTEARVRALIDEECHADWELRAAVAAVFAHESKFQPVGPAGHTPRRPDPGPSSATDVGMGQMVLDTFRALKKARPERITFGHAHLILPQYAVIATAEFLRWVSAKYKRGIEFALFRYAGAGSKMTFEEYQSDPRGLIQFYRTERERVIDAGGVM